jgi:thioredoxin-like negative regulator of GroEL
MSKTYSNVAFGKVDVDENSDAAVQFEISVVPTFITFDGEKVMHKFSGADPKQLEDHVNRLSTQ